MSFRHFSRISFRDYPTFFFRIIWSFSWNSLGHYSSDSKRNFWLNVLQIVFLEIPLLISDSCTELFQGLLQKFMQKFCPEFLQDFFQGYSYEFRNSLRNASLTFFRNSFRNSWICFAMNTYLLRFSYLFLQILLLAFFFWITFTVSFRNSYINLTSDFTTKKFRELFV